jgi:hypothetical protein
LLTQRRPSLQQWTAKPLFTAKYSKITISDITMRRRKILKAAYVGSLAAIAGCTNEPGGNSDEQQTSETTTETDGGSDGKQTTESGSPNRSERRADFLFNNKVTRTQEVTMTVTDDSESVVFQESYRLDSQGEKKVTVPELRGELLDYEFETDAASATKRWAPDRPSQLRVNVRSGEIDLFVVA